MHVPALLAFWIGAATGAALMGIVVLAVEVSRRRRASAEYSGDQDRDLLRMSADVARELSPRSPAGYERCKNFATCGWWFKKFALNPQLDECNHCWNEGDPFDLADCEEDLEIGPDWREAS